jgi:hypothetical protein
MIHSTTAMSALCGIFLVFAVRPFVAARRGRPTASI